MKVRIAILLAASSMFCVSRQIERVWTDDQGRNTKATLLRVDNDNAILQMPDGREIPFPMAKLSKNDQLWIKNYSQEQEQTEKKEVSEPKLNFDDPWPDRIRFDEDPQITVAKEDKENKEFIYESANYRFNCNVMLAQSLVKNFAVMFETTHEFVRTLPVALDGGTKKNGKYEIFLFETEAEYHAAGGPPGSAGVYIGGKNIVLVPLTSVGVKKAGSKYLVDRTESSKTLPHELVHQLTPNPYYAEGSMGWFTEGIAEYVAVTPYRNSGTFSVKSNTRPFIEYVTAYGDRGMGGRALGKEIRIGSLKSYMLQSYSSFTNNAGLNYGVGLLITNYFFHMDREEDGARIKKFLKALREGTTGEAALNVLLDGQTWEELEADIIKAYSSKGVRFTFSN